MDLSNIIDDNLMKYIGILVVIVAIIYIIIKLANIQLGVVDSLINNNNNIVEGMANNEDSILENLKNKESEITKQIDINKGKMTDKVKEQIENNLLKYDDFINYKIVNLVSELNDDKESVSQLNELIKLKENLQKIPDIIEEI
jgi:predicted PurR-regulated permease PerM